MKPKDFEGKIELLPMIHKGICPFNFRAYALLVAIANYAPKDSLYAGRAMWYLDESVDPDEKLRQARGEGSFGSAVTEGDTLLALKRAGDEYYKAIATAIYYKELDL